MNVLTFENLDFACAEVGKTLAKQPSKDLENTITNALAVLEEQGIYALFLFLETRGSNKGKNVIQELHAFLKDTPQQSLLLSNGADIFESLQQISNDLNKLLLAHDLVRQSLIYARYHARASQTNEVQT